MWKCIVLSQRLAKPGRPVAHAVEDA